MHRYHADTSGRILRERRLLFATVGPRESGNAPAESEPLPQVESERRVEDLGEGATPTELQNLRREVERGSVPVISASQDISDQQDPQTPSGASSDTPPSNKDAQSESSEKNNEKGDFIKEIIRFVFEFMQSVTEGRLSLSDFAQRKSVERAARDIDQQIAQIDLALAGDGLTPDQIQILQNRRTELDEQAEILKAQSKTIQEEEQAQAAVQTQSQAPEAHSNNPSSAAMEFLARFLEMDNRGDLDAREVADVTALLVSEGEQGEIQAFFDGFNSALRSQAAERGGSLSDNDLRDIREFVRLINSALEARGNSTDRIQFQNGVLVLQKVQSTASAENPPSRRRQRRRGSSPERRRAERSTERVPTPRTEGARILMSLGINMRPEVQDNMVDGILRAGGRVDTGEIDDVVSRLTGDFSSAQSVIQALNTAIADFRVSDTEMQRAADALNNRLQGADFQIGTGPRINGQSVLVIERGPGIQR